MKASPSTPTTGVRQESVLQPIPSAVAKRTIEIAESAGWPVWERGFWWTGKLASGLSKWSTNPNAPPAAEDPISRAIAKTP